MMLSARLIRTITRGRLLGRLSTGSLYKIPRSDVRGASCTVDLAEDSSLTPLQTFTQMHDFDPSRCSPVYNASMEEDWSVLMRLAAARPQPKFHIVAVEMDLLQAAGARKAFDKILLLVEPCEVESNNALTQRGIGQALSLARRTSAFLSRETGLLPELVLTAPISGSIQTALYALAQFSPKTCQTTAWICHPCLSAVPSNIDSLDRMFDGVEYAPYESHHAHNSDNKQDWLQRADSMLEFIQKREEQVIVGTFTVAIRR
jgi:hypothetical protein